MKFFLFFILFFSLKLIKNEFLEFIDSNIDADCNEIKKAHPEMKIVCQDNTILSHSEPDLKINNKKENSNEKTIKPQESFDSLASIDSILNEENNLIINPADKAAKKTKNSIENSISSEKIDKKPDAALDFNSIMSAENDVINKLKTIDFTSKTSGFSNDIPSQNEEKNNKKDEIDAGKFTGLDPEMDSLLNKKNYLNINLQENNAKSEKSKKNIEIAENKSNFQKKNQNFTNNDEKTGEKTNFLGNINSDYKSSNKKITKIEENSSQNFIFKEKSNEIFPNDNENSQQLRIDNIAKQQRNLEISFENFAKTINNKLKPDLFLSEIKENNSENMKNIKNLLISEQNKEKSAEIVQSITDIANNQKNIQKQMEELNQNQKNLLKFLQTRFLDKKEKEADLSGFMRLKAASSSEETSTITNEKENNEEPVQAPIIDYKQKLMDLFDLIKKELK